MPRSLLDNPSTRQEGQDQEGRDADLSGQLEHTRFRRSLGRLVTLAHSIPASARDYIRISALLSVQSLDDHLKLIDESTRFGFFLRWCFDQTVRTIGEGDNDVYLVDVLPQ